MRGVELGEFYAWLGSKKSRRIRLAVMDTHLGEALDQVRRASTGGVVGSERIRP
jgi:hypothetical protein